MPPVADVEATAFNAEVELATALDDAAAAKVAIALDGAGVGVVVGRSWIVPGIVDGVATVIGAGVEITMVDTVAADVVDGVATAAGVGIATKPGNGSGGVGTAIGPSVGKGLTTEGAGMGVGARAD